MSKKNTPPKKSSQVDIVKGRLDISRGGMGFVIVEGSDKDIIVRPNDFNRAFHGDIVRVQVNRGAAAKGKRPEGKITDIAERKQTEFIGISSSTRISHFLWPHLKSLCRIFISPRTN
jgi:ribonuclease R